jgi:hypothetical protein
MQTVAFRGSRNRRCVAALARCTAPGPISLQLGGDRAQEGIAILRRKRLGAIHHGLEFGIAQRDGHGGFLPKA